MINFERHQSKNRTYNAILEAVSRLFTTKSQSEILSPNLCLFIKAELDKSIFFFFLYCFSQNNEL